MQIPSFNGPSYTLGSGKVSSQRSVNLFPEVSEAATKNGEQYHYVATPGTNLLATMAGGKGRGLWAASNGRSFAVVGRNVYEVTTPTAPVLLGSMDENASGPVSMADNGVELMIVNGRNGYTLNFATNTLAMIQQDAWLGASFVCFIDGYFVVTQPNSKQFNISGIFDGTTWNGLDEANKITQPDNLVGAIESFERLCLIGTKSSEAWRNTGNADFPFERETEIEIGTAAANTIAKLNGYPIFLAQEPDGNITVTHFYGFVPKRVSTHAVEQAIKACADIANATAWTYQDAGHSFWVLNLPGSSVSWAYDSATGLWHERTYMDPQRGEMRHRVEHHCYAGGKHLAQDFDNGNLYELTSEPMISTDDPQATLRWSNDGGLKYVGQQTTSIGKLGETTRRVIYRRLGQARDRVFDLSMVDPVLTDNGAPIIRRRTFPHLAQEGLLLFFRMLQIDMLTGLQKPITLVSAWLDAGAGKD